MDAKGIQWKSVHKRRADPKIAHLQVLVIVAASHLDAVTFQICSQSFKIMPTAVFAAWLLGQHLTVMQWSSLPVSALLLVMPDCRAFMPRSHSCAVADILSQGRMLLCTKVLAAGVILVTLNTSQPAANSQGNKEDYDLIVGLGASALSGLSSAYAGVYFEK